MNDFEAVTLTPEIQALVNGALDTGNPMLLAAVSADGPVLSYRGSIQVFDNGRLGLWVRNQKGNTLDAIRQNPGVALMYRSPTVPMLQFRGRARITEDALERERIFSLSPQRERDADPERNGIAVLIEVTAVEGVLGLVDGRPNPIRLGTAS